VSSARIVETLDELEDSNARFGLRLEAIAIEQLAFERAGAFLPLWTPKTPKVGCPQNRANFKTLVLSPSIWPKSGRDMHSVYLGGLESPIEIAGSTNLRSGCTVVSSFTCKR
jgi:hypothetical protein